MDESLSGSSYNRANQINNLVLPEVSVPREELSKETKAEILREALFLRDKYHADPNEWITPSDYQAASSKDNVIRLEETKKLNDKRLNKYTATWFSMIDAWVFQNLVCLPAADLQRQEIEGKISGFRDVIKEELDRVKGEGELLMKKDFLNSSEFVGFYNTIKNYKEEGGTDVEQLYRWLRRGAIKEIADYFKIQDQDVIIMLVEKLQDMKKQYIAINKEAVDAGNKILDIIIKEFGSK